VEEAEKSLDETRHRLARREKELQQQNDRIVQLQDQLSHTQVAHKFTSKLKLKLGIL
jgi:hypothetical protein